MKQDKTKNDSRGAKYNCINFQLCPFCYGCRNYREDDPDCKECKEENAKYNICNTLKHKDAVINKMVIKQKISMEEIKHGR